MSVKEKRLLILGAGGHGKVAAEIAEDCGFTQIAFLDDNSPEALGKINAFADYVTEYPQAFVGIGNNHLRGELMNNLALAGFSLPALVHPTAYVSRTAVIGAGTVVEPMAIVNANTLVGQGCILSVGSIVDHNVILGDCVHINSGAIVKAGATVEKETKLEAGQVILGYPGAVVKRSEGV